LQVLIVAKIKATPFPDPHSRKKIFVHGPPLPLVVVGADDTLVVERVDTVGLTDVVSTVNAQNNNNGK